MIYELGTLREKDSFAACVQWMEVSLTSHLALHWHVSIDVFWAALGSKSHGAGISR